MQNHGNNEYSVTTNTCCVYLLIAYLVMLFLDVLSKAERSDAAVRLWFGFAV